MTIEHSVDQILQQNQPWKTIALTHDDYETFKKCYSLMGLTGISYGQAFCEYFNVHDYMIRYDSNNKRVDKLIRHSYLKRQQVIQELYRKDK
jgi:hypothetical protein